MQCLQTLFVDCDHDVRLSVGGAYQSTSKSLSSPNLDEKQYSHDNTKQKDQFNIQS